jgi:hypothetical protein
VSETPTAEEELRATLERVGQCFDQLNVPWAIGGSFASTVYGEPRATNDVDIIAELRPAHVAPFVASLGADFYADATMMREAIAARDSFNIIDERSFLKVDVFVPRPGPLGEGQLARRRSYALSAAGPTVFVLGPEDTVLQKLRWFELSGRTSDRQWRDIVGVVRLGGDLDIGYLREVADASSLSESLARALAEGGR